MASILYAWEYGSDLGHVSVFLPIAKQLREQGHSVTFSIPFLVSGAGVIKKLLAENNFESIDVPGSYTKSTARLSGSHAEIIQSLPSFRSQDDFSFYFRSWLSVYEELAPDVVVCDFAPVANLAARACSIPSVLIDVGFFIPDTTQELPLISDYISIVGHERTKEESLKIRDQAELEVLALINNTFAQLGFPALPSFSEIYRAQKILWTNYPELSPFSNSQHSCFAGMVINENGGVLPRWKLNKFDKPKVFAYLKMGTETTKIIINALLADENLDVIMYVAGSGESLKNTYSADHIQIESSPLNTSVVLQEADLVICGAGAGMVAQSLLAGKPMLLVPNYMEQHLNARTAIKLGAALMAQIDSTVESVQEKIYQLLGVAFHTAAARSFAYKNKPADTTYLANEIAACIPAAQKQSNVIKPRSQPEEYDFSQFDVVFLSYDEPNADENWEVLKKQVPSAKRVHGVKGFDAAHKAAAEAAETERFILVDADNQIDPAFFRLKTRVPANFKHSVWQWSSVNEVTGLIYPFGGVKVWTREIVRKMRSHELCNEEDGLLLDFWSQPAYQAFCLPFSRNYTNGSPYQAFRAAYREAVKIGDVFGMESFAEEVQKNANSAHSRRLCIWMSVGADTDNGYWSMLGARLGGLHCLDAALKPSNINAYDWFDELWYEQYSRIVGEDSAHYSGKTKGVFCSQALKDEVRKLGELIRLKITRPPVLDMSPDESRNFKFAMAAKAEKDISLFVPFELQKDIC